MPDAGGQGSKAQQDEGEGHTAPRGAPFLALAPQPWLWTKLNLDHAPGGCRPNGSPSPASPLRGRRHFQAPEPAHRLRTR